MNLFLSLRGSPRDTASPKGQQSICIGSGSKRMVEPPGVSIRLATTQDLSAISDLMYASFVEYKALYTVAGFAATTPTSDQLASRMVEGPLWVAELNGVVIGTVSAILCGEDLYIRGMAVLPAARGHRLGELLLRQAEQFAQAQECKRLVLSTTPFLRQAIKLYERYGFRRTEEDPHELFGTPLFTMAKDLMRN